MLFASHIASQQTERGGYTERRYTPIDLFELLVLADLRRRGFSVGQLRRLLDTLRDQFGERLFEATGGGGPLTLLTDGQEIYGRTADRRALQPAARSAAAAAGDRRCRRRSARAEGVDAGEDSAEERYGRKRSRTALGVRSNGRQPDREDLVEVVGRTRDDVDADQLADAARGGGAGVGRGLHGADVAADDRGDQAGIDLLPADEDDVRGLHHRVGRFDHADQAARFDHAERVAEQVLCHWSCRFYVIRPRAATGSVSITWSPSTSRTTSTRFDTTQEWFGTTRTRSPGLERACRP